MNNIKKRQTYIARIDVCDPKGRLWLSGVKRKLTDEEAEPYLKLNRIVWYEEKPRKFVRIINPNNTETTIAWGQYLKEKYKLKRRNYEEKF